MFEKKNCRVNFFFRTVSKRYFLLIRTPFSFITFFHWCHRVCLKKSCHVDRDRADSRLNCHPEGFCTGKMTQSYFDIIWKTKWKNMFFSKYKLFTFRVGEGILGKLEWDFQKVYCYGISSGPGNLKKVQVKSHEIK